MARRDEHRRRVVRGARRARGPRGRGGRRARSSSSPTAASSSRRWAGASVVGAGRSARPQAWDAIWGNTLVGAYALAATRHMAQYGTTAEQLAEIAVTFRRHAGFNPSAQYRDPITVDDVLGSRMVADPLHMLDCCVVSDGGGACIVTTEERARDLPGEPVYVLGGAHTLTHALNVSQSDDLTVASAARSGPLALQRAGVTLDDVDVLQLYDSFTITVLLTLEGPRVLRDGGGGSVRGERSPRLRRSAADEHRRRRALRVPPGHARHVPDRRSGAPAARAGRRDPGARRQDRARPTAPAGCSRPGRPCCSERRHRDSRPLASPSGFAQTRSAEGELRWDRLRPPDASRETRSAEGELRWDRLRPPDASRETRSAEGELRWDRLRPPDASRETLSAEGELRWDRLRPPDASRETRSAEGELR